MLWVKEEGRTGGREGVKKNIKFQKLVFLLTMVLRVRLVLGPTLRKLL